MTDCLIASVNQSIEINKKGIEMKIIHQASAIIAVALAGLTSAAYAQTAPEEGKSAVADKVRSEATLKVGVIVNAPFIMQDPIQDEYVGPAADFMNAAAAGLGAKVEWVPVNWDTMIAGLQAKQYDVLATAVYATPARKAVVDFVSYSKSGVCYVARKNNDKVNTLADIKSQDLSMVIPSGASYTAELPKAYPKLDVSSKQMPPGGGNFYDDVLTERVDLSPFESLIAAQVVAAQPELKVIPNVDECLAAPDFPIDIGIAINKGDSEFEAYLNDVVKAAAPAIEKAVKDASAH